MENDEIKPGERYTLNVNWGGTKYKSYIKVFSDQKHFENWYEFVASRGGKVTGINLIKESDENK